MSAKGKIVTLKTFHVSISNYDLVVYGSQSGSPPHDGNLAGKEMAQLTASGTCPDVKMRGVFIVKFFPTGSTLHSPTYAISNQAVQVNVDMDVCQLAGVMAVLQTKSPLAYYFESAGQGNTVLPFAEITTQNGA
jgi:hypothetical protein